MVIEMFNGWYFLWLVLAAGATVGVYFALRGRSRFTQEVTLFLLLVSGVLLHFLKVLTPPYSEDTARMLRDSWFINICGANIALFPFLFFSNNRYVKDYMFFIGVASGLLALVYPQEPMDKLDQMGEFWDILRFYYHHWMLMTVPLMLVLLGHHRISYRRVWALPVGLLLLMLFIMLNQIFQSELGFVPLRGDQMLQIGYKNSSFIWGPWGDDPISKFLSGLCPNCFKTVPVGPYAGKAKYWPWFWLVVPAFVVIPPVAFAVSMIFDRKAFLADARMLREKLRARFAK